MISIVPTTNYNTNFKAVHTKPKLDDLAKAISAITAGENILPKNAAPVMLEKKSKGLLSRIFSSVIKFFDDTKGRNYIEEYKAQLLDNMYKHGQLSVINRKFDTKERIRELEYAHGAYTKFVYVSDLINLPHINRNGDEYKVVKKRVWFFDQRDLDIKIISEERFPSGETKYYECQIVAQDSFAQDLYEDIRQHLKKHVLSDGTTYTYDYYPNGNKREVICSDGSKETYYDNGKLESKISRAGSKKTYFQNGNIKAEYDKQGKLVKSNLIK